MVQTKMFSTPCEFSPVLPYFAPCHKGCSKLASDKLGVSLSAERLRALNRCTHSTVNDELWEDTESSGNTEQNSVVVGFSESVVLEKDTAVGIDVGVLLRLA
jgi:hypothetical protein